MDKVVENKRLAPEGISLGNRSMRADGTNGTNGNGGSDQFH